MWKLFYSKNFMEKGIFIANILYACLVFLNFLLEKVEPSFQYKGVIKKKKKR